MCNVKIIPQNTIQVQGNLFRVHRGEPRKGGGVRGCVQEFSRQSQSRLVEKMLTLEWNQISDSYVVRFVTLTTPTEYWNRLPFVYGCLDTMRRVFVERGAAGAFVRRERGARRGMLHYHLLVVIPRGHQGGWLPEDPELPEGWIGAAWREALGYGSRVRVTSEIPQNWDNVQRYITKYCAKTAFDTVEKSPHTCQGGFAEPAACVDSLSKAHNAENMKFCSKTGHNGNRHWYVWGKSRLPWAAPGTFRIGRRGIRWTYLVKRVFRKVIKQRLIRQNMRRALGDRGKGIPDSEIRSVFLEFCGVDGERHIRRSVSESRLYRYMCKGWFSGWRLWCNSSDLEILNRLMILTERV